MDGGGGGAAGFSLGPLRPGLRSLVCLVIGSALHRPPAASPGWERQLPAWAAGPAAGAGPGGYLDQLAEADEDGTSGALTGGAPAGGPRAGGQAAAAPRPNTPACGGLACECIVCRPGVQINLVVAWRASVCCVVEASAFTAD